MGRPVFRTDAVNSELDELGQSFVIGLESGGTVVRPSETYSPNSFAQIELVRARVAPLGRLLFELMRLDQISEDDLLQTYRDLGGEP
jgi:hypothetical protein